MLFGIGTTFIDTIDMFYKGINSSVVVNFKTSHRFDRKCDITQGCTNTPFLFILVGELLTLNIVYD